jgi:hypothetical protein
VAHLQQNNQMDEKTISFLLQLVQKELDNQAEITAGQLQAD